MKHSKRRSFICFAATAVSSFPILDILAEQEEKKSFSLARSAVETGLSQGLQFRDQDTKILKLLQRFSTRQLMLGGGVLTFAAEEETEWIHLLVQIDNLEKFRETMTMEEAPWGSAQASHGNTLSFEYEGQLYYLETLVKEEFSKRLAGLRKPGTEINGFRLEFAHDAVLYDLQKRRHYDPFGAIGRGNQIELKKIAKDKGIPTALRVIIEEKALGLKVSKEEKARAEAQLQGNFITKKDSQKDAIEVLGGVSRLARAGGSELVENVIGSAVSENALEENVGEDSRHVRGTRNALDTIVNGELSEGSLWHLSLRCEEETDHPECEVAAELALAELGGYDDFLTRRDLTSSMRAIHENDRVKRKREKEPELEELMLQARRAQPASYSSTSASGPMTGSASSGKLRTRGKQKSLLPPESRPTIIIDEKILERQRRTPVPVPLIKRRLPEQK